jgi:hypothetical protein
MTTTTMIVMLVSLMSVTFQPKDEPKEANINAISSKNIASQTNPAKFVVFLVK